MLVPQGLARHWGTAVSRVAPATRRSVQDSSAKRKSVSSDWCYPGKDRVLGSTGWVLHLASGNQGRLPGGGEVYIEDWR